MSETSKLASDATTKKKKQIEFIQYLLFRFDGEYAMFFLARNKKKCLQSNFLFQLKKTSS